jgi:Mg-chelatase subunit ChlD
VFAFTDLQKLGGRGAIRPYCRPLRYYKGGFEMKPQITEKVFLSILVAFMVFNLTANGYGSSTDENQTTDTPKLDIIFTLDNSGSMLKNDPNFITRQVVKNFLAGLGEEVRVGMVVFDQDARLVEPLAVIMPFETTTSFLKSLETIDYRGKFTNSPAGIERAIYELNNRGRKTAGKVIILLTDGIVDTGDKYQDREAENWLKDHLTQECQKSGIRIFGIAFTDKADFRLIQILASKTNGEYFRAYSAEDIPDVFKKIIEIITQPPPAKRKPKIPDASATVIPLARKAAPQPAAPVEKTPVTKGIAVLPLILSVAVLIMGVIVLVLIFTRKTEDPIGSKLSRAMPETPLPPDHPVFQAELIDAENIVSMDSLSLALNKESVTVGRDSSNDIVIPKESISSLHATIDYQNGHFYLEDHRSTNGTRLNGKDIGKNDPVRLKSGDKIHFAIYEFRFLLHDKAPYGETVMIDKEEI